MEDYSLDSSGGTVQGGETQDPAERFRDYAVELLFNRAMPEGEVVSKLQDEGMDREAAEKLVDELMANPNPENGGVVGAEGAGISGDVRICLIDIGRGVLITAMAIGISMWSYNSVKDSGGTYVVASGAAAWGVIMFFRGFFGLLKGLFKR